MAKASRGGWLFKEEPTHYSFSDLERDGSAVWEGVTNNLALKNLRNMQVGDSVLYYHTGNVKAIVGEMTVTEGPRVDPKNSKSVVVTVKPVRSWRRPVTLAEMKSDPQLASWDLIRISRLSVVAINPQQWKRLTELENASPPSAGA